MSDEIELPESHPLHGKSELLDTHSGHLQAYSDVLDEADSDEVHGVMLLMYTNEAMETLPSVSPDVDPRFASLWMLGSHIHHVASSAQQSGGNATMEDVAKDAIEYVRNHGVGVDQ